MNNTTCTATIIEEQPNYNIQCNLINGELSKWNGETANISTPLNGACIGTHPVSDKATAIAALDAASTAYNSGRGAWPTASMDVRIAAIEAFNVGLFEQREEIARLIVWEIAKTKADAYKEVDRTIQYIKDTVEAAKDTVAAGAAPINTDGIVAQVRRAPLGVVLCMGPFNYPLNETLCTMIPALIMGNTTVVKPPRVGQLFYGVLAEICQRVFPAGVVNIVFGEGRTVCNSIMEDGRVDALAFIGSSLAANTLLKAHPRPNRLRPILGLEAKNPAIVMKDAELENAANEIVSGALSFNGQRCTALKIIFVHKDIEGTLTALIKKKIEALVVGSPLVYGTNITPLAEPGKPEKLLKMVSQAVSNGAVLINDGGGTIKDQLFTPAFVGNINKQCRLWNEEQFGPVVPMVSFSEFEEVMEYIASSSYGQQASIFSESPELVGQMVDALAGQVCRININCQCQRGPDVLPFTGRKDSAVGTLSVSDALRCFSIRSVAACKDNARAQSLLTAIKDGDHSSFLSDGKE